MSRRVVFRVYQEGEKPYPCIEGGGMHPCCELLGHQKNLFICGAGLTRSDVDHVFECVLCGCIDMFKAREDGSLEWIFGDGKPIE